MEVQCVICEAQNNLDVYRVMTSDVKHCINFNFVQYRVQTNQIQLL